MHIFVKNRRQHLIRFGFGRERYVIDIIAGQKISGNAAVGFTVAADRTISIVGFITFKNDNGRRNCRIHIQFRQNKAQDFAELFEFDGNAANFLFFGVADQKEIFRPHISPFVSGKRGGTE